VLYNVHFTAFSLGGRFFRTRCTCRTKVQKSFDRFQKWKKSPYNYNARNIICTWYTNTIQCKVCHL